MFMKKQGTCAMKFFDYISSKQPQLLVIVRNVNMMGYIFNSAIINEALKY